MSEITFGSLFAGIGGFDLAFERAGMTCKWQVEIDDYATKVLEKHWPKVRRCRDVCEFPPKPIEDWRVDVICGGFPCQPVSCAGKRKGKDDSRWLWPQFHRVLSDLRPRFAVIENVPGLLTRGASGVIFDLASIGYDAEWRVLSAAEFGAPHIRKRLFIVAHSRSDGIHLERGWFAGAGRENAVHVDGYGQVWEISHADSQGESQSQRVEQKQRGRTSNGSEKVSDNERIGCGSVEQPIAQGTQGEGPASATEHGSQSRGWGWWEAEPDVGRVADGVPSRVDRLKCLGNAVVPQVAEWVGRRVMEIL